MKIIDLLNKIANGEEVPLIKYENNILHWNKEKSRLEDKDSMNTLYEIDFSNLNDEVEILETTLNTKNMNITYQDNKLKEQMSELQSEIDKLENQIGKLHNEAHSLRDSNTHMKNKLRELMKMIK